MQTSPAFINIKTSLCVKIITKAFSALLNWWLKRGSRKSFIRVNTKINFIDTKCFTTVFANLVNADFSFWMTGVQTLNTFVDIFTACGGAVQGFISRWTEGFWQLMTHERSYCVVTLPAGIAGFVHTLVLVNARPQSKAELETFVTFLVAFVSPVGVPALFLFRLTAM